jgi:DNA-binding NarL/FixJ family response regulator
VFSEHGGDSDGSYLIAWLPDGLGGTVLRVLICDKLPVVRSGLRALLEGAGIEVIEATDSGLHAIMLARRIRPDVVITGLELLSLGGIELIRRLTDLDDMPSPRVVVYLMTDSDEVVSEVLHAGASGVLLWGTGREELVSAVHAAANGEAVLAPVVAQRLVDWFRRGHTEPEPGLSRLVSTLTPREREVLLLLAAGMQPDEIAGELFIGVTTVRTHIYRLRGKLDLKDRAQLVTFAYRAGLTQPA